MRKRILSVLSLMLLVVFLSGCSVIFDLINAGLDIIDEYTKEEYDYTYPDFDYSSISTLSDIYKGAMPSTGNVKALVLLIEFPDQTHKSVYSKEYMENVLFGTKSSSSYPSISDFYRSSSYGKLEITGDVYGWYTTENKSNYYSRNYSDYTSDVVIKEALDYYKDTIDFSSYDSNNDGYIDAVYAIYSRRYDTSSDVWWAYQTTYEDYETREKGLKLGDVTFSGYIWASVSFLEDDMGFMASPINTTTYIHETGHLMGLDDYYDYDYTVGSNAGLGGADMMDYNVGDHCSISKMLLGWIDPIVVDLSKDQTIQISSFTETGQVLLIPNGTYENIFSEYYLVELYTPTGLNTTNTYFTRYGVRILHVDATLDEGGMSGSYFTYFNNDNTDTTNAFVAMVTRGGLFVGSEAKNSDLFYSGQSFVAANYTWYDNTTSDFILLVESISTIDKTAVIKIDVNDVE